MVRLSGAPLATLMNSVENPPPTTGEGDRGEGSRSSVRSRSNGRRTSKASASPEAPISRHGPYNNLASDWFGPAGTAKAWFTNWSWRPRTARYSCALARSEREDRLPVATSGRRLRNEPTEFRELIANQWFPPRAPRASGRLRSVVGCLGGCPTPSNRTAWLVRESVGCSSAAFNRVRNGPGSGEERPGPLRFTSRAARASGHLRNEAESGRLGGRPEPN
jgi:hypothetical protein